MVIFNNEGRKILNFTQAVNPSMPLASGTMARASSHAESHAASMSEAFGL
jgi:hypothetical protein